MTFRNLDDAKLLIEFLAWWDELPPEKKTELEGDHAAIVAAFIARKPPFRWYG